MGELASVNKQLLNYRTIILPIDAGGLSQQGTFDSSAKEPASDVAEIENAGRRRAVLVHRDNEYQIRPLNCDEPEQQAEEEDDAADWYPCASARGAAAATARQQGMVVSLLLPLKVPPDGAEEGAGSHYLLLLKRARKAADESPEEAVSVKPPTLQEHNGQAGEQAKRIAEALGLEENIKQALTLAASWHDKGKDRKVWQRSIYNENYQEPLAKSGPLGMNWHLLGGYRHEFGSLLDAEADRVISKHPERDLILHLIAAHHGWARPHFEHNVKRSAYDHEKSTTNRNQGAAHEVMRRFGRLQQRFGRWSLAWLESLMRCADIIASRQAVETEPEEDER